MAAVDVQVKKAVVAALTTRFAADPEFNGENDAQRDVAVRYGYDFAAADTLAEQVYFGQSRAATPPTGQRAGTHLRKEHGSLELTVLVLFVDGGPEDAEERVAAIGAEVEDWFDTHKNGHADGVDVAGLHELVLDGWEADYAGIQGGARGIRTYQITYKARLQEAS